VRRPRRGLVRFVVLLVVSGGAGAFVLAQAPQVPPPAFEAVSIKPNVSGSGNVSVTTTRGQLMGTNIPVRMLVRMAHGVQDFQVVDLPDWAENSRYDVTARGANEPGEPFRARLRQMLVDRFGAQITRGARELPIYALVVNRPGTLGPSLKTTSIEDCTPQGSGCGTSINNRVVRATAVEMASLAVTLASFVGRTVIDRTGLSGRYDAQLSWTSDPRGGAAPGDDGPSIFTAVQEQLGLKLDAQRGPVDVVIVSRLERPTED
jgi:uncharacterized protein (TIGR03435 family)